MNIFLTISIKIKKSSTLTFFLMVETVELLIYLEQIFHGDYPAV
jgi:hypothetical protein